ncbi:hypothetical protein VKT23_017702 [Stygiomarasmius scandens]|uniref:Uncharacterized protein n=1 Tax=Marasmiellus scandens TaxID=2682957 RepID=A0ABR1IR27_9AGAR
MKDAILPWLPDVLKQDLDPPIKPDTNKEKTRGFYHPDIGCLLCTPIKLPIYDWDPKKFCHQARENELEDGPITGSHFPAVFCGDLGEEASDGKDFVFHNLLYGWLLVLTWVFLYLGRNNAAKFRKHMSGLCETNGTSTMFRVQKTGKAYRCRLTSITYHTIAYASFVLRYTLLASDDHRIEEGGVIKQHAFDAVVAVFKDERFMDMDWIKETLQNWQTQVSWMLPTEKQPEILDKDDTASSLNQIAHILQKKKEMKAASSAMSTSANSSDAPINSENGTSTSPSTPPATSSPLSEPAVNPSEQPLKTITNTSMATVPAPDPSSTSSSMPFSMLTPGPPGTTIASKPSLVTAAKPRSTTAFGPIR